MILLCLFTPSLSAAEVADFTIEWLDDSSFPVLKIYYSTTDSQGRPAGPLWVPDRVRIQEQNLPHRPGGFEDGEHAPAYLSLVIDSSGSMEGSQEEVLEAARLLIDKIDYNDRMEIIDFDSRVVSRCSFTRDTDTLRSALVSIDAGGGTALYDAVAVALDKLKNKQGMKTLLILSDGEDENSTHHNLASIKECLEREGVRAFCIALGEDFDQKVLKEIATVSQGAFYHAPNAQEVSEIYHSVITYLHSLHRMWYSTAFGSFDGTERQFTIQSQETGTSHKAVYTAPKANFWSSTLYPWKERRAAPIKISPDGQYISQLQYHSLIDKSGRRLCREDWQERYDGMMSEHFIAGWLHRDYGFLEHYDPETGSIERIDDLQIIDQDSRGNFHREWVWRPKAISNNERYLVMCTDVREVSDSEYDYHFLLYDRIDKQVLWEQPFFQGDFDEPGPAAVSDQGLSAVVQEGNLYLVNPDGSLRSSLIWKDNGRYWDRMDMDSQGRYILGRICGDEKIWLYSGDGKLLWEKASHSHETAGFLAVSPNGNYLAYADLWGPHILNPAGEPLFELNLDREIPYGNGIDVADNGAFIYSLGNRIFYQLLE